MLSILTAIVGHYSHKGHSNINGEDHVPGTSEVLFVILFLGKLNGFIIDLGFYHSLS